MYKATWFGIRRTEVYTIPGTECYGNATKSAVHAGYSEKTAYSQGQRMLK
ncbi:terminase small subunit, partial [Staphylococcus aureus]